MPRARTRLFNKSNDCWVTLGEMIRFIPTTTTTSKYCHDVPNTPTTHNQPHNTLAGDATTNSSSMSPTEPRATDCGNAGRQLSCGGIAHVIRYHPWKLQRTFCFSTLLATTTASVIACVAGRFGSLDFTQVLCTNGWRSAGGELASSSIAAATLAAHLLQLPVCHHQAHPGWCATKSLMMRLHSLCVTDDAQIELGGPRVLLSA